MSLPAMSAVQDGKWEPLSDIKIDEWCLLKDDLGNSKVNDSSSKLTKYEIAEQVLHDIEDLGRNNTEYWLDEFPLFDEIHTVKPNDDDRSKREQEIESFDFILDQEPVSPSNGSAVLNIHKQLSDQQDLFSVSYEDTATIFYINNEPFLSFTPVQQGYENSFGYNEEKERKTTTSDNSVEKEDINFDLQQWDGDNATDDKKEMAVVEEILKNTALELDQWESDTSRFEMSSDGMISACSSPKEGGGEDEADDRDWKPSPPMDDGPKLKRWSKSVCRNGSEEERKLRKKEQNKNAATRYRQKKKAEVSEILKEEELLKQKKAKLEEKMGDIQSEIKCLKGLMRELFRAKGMIK